MEHDIHGMILFHHGGEGLTLSETEWTTTLSAVMDHTDGMIKIGVDCTRSSIETTLKTAQNAASLGAHFAVIAPPSGLLPSRIGILQYLQQLIAASPLPVAVCNDPSRCTVDIPLAIAVQLGELDNTVAYIENSVDITAITASANELKGRIPIAAGHDLLAIQALLSGASGIVSSSAMFIPEIWSTMWKHWSQRRTADAAVGINNLNGVLHCLDTPPRESSVKAALSLRGRCEPETRLPFTWPTRATLYRLAAEMEKADIHIQTGDL